MDPKLGAYNIYDLREMARRKLPTGVFEFVDRGTDVVKALALGAKAVFIGRASLYGVAAHGEAGALRAINIFREEIDRTIALLGARSIEELDNRFLHIGDAVTHPRKHTEGHG